MNKIAIFASGGGSNADKICEYFDQDPKTKVCLILSNRKQAGVLSVAEKWSVDSKVFSKKSLHESNEILTLLADYEIQAIILAGFLLLVPEYLIHTYKNKILNIHPALLPKYGGKGMYGMNVHKAVVENREQESGISIHLVNEKFDDGAIIFQTSCKLKSSDTAEDVQRKVLDLEHKYFPLVIKKWIESSLY